MYTLKYYMGPNYSPLIFFLPLLGTILMAMVTSAVPFSPAANNWRIHSPTTLSATATGSTISCLDDIRYAVALPDRP